MDGPDCRVWSRPLVASENVVVTTTTALLVARVPLNQLSAFEADIRGGVPVQAIVIPWSEMREVIVGATEPMLQLLHGAGPTLTEVFFDRAAVRDEVVTEMARQLGPTWRLEDRDRTQAGALFLLLPILIVVTLVVFFATRASEARTDTTGFEFVAETIGSLGALAIGGGLSLLCLGAAIWLSVTPPKGTTVSLTRMASGKGD